jgi:hypothetical protein
MSDLIVENIVEKHIEITNKDVNKFFVPLECSFELKNAPPEVSSGLVRVLGYEKEGYSFDVDYDDIRTTSGDINIMEIYYNIILSPLRYDTTDDDLDIELYIDVRNDGNSAMLVTFDQLKYKSKNIPKVALTHPDNELIYLNAGDRLQIKNITITKGINHARFINVSAPRIFPLDRMKSLDKKYPFGDKTPMSNPTHHLISFEVPTCIVGHKNVTKKLVLIACDVILARLENLQHIVKTESIEVIQTDQMLSFQIIETNTIAKLLERFCVEKLKNLKSVVSVIVYPDDTFIFTLHVEDPLRSFMKVIDECKKVYSAIKKSVLI